MSDSRAVARIEVLAGVDRGGRSDRLLDRALERSDLDLRDRRLVTETVYGALRRQRQLDRTLQPYVRRRWHSLDPTVRAALRVAAYQAACLDSVPAHAAIDSAVGAVKRITPRAAGLVNAVLRSWQRDGGRLLDPAGDEAERMQVPRWLLDRFRRRGGGEATGWLESTAERPVIALRVARSAAGGAAGVAEVLEAEGVVAAPSPWSEWSLRVVSGNFLDSTPFREGSVVPQSEAAQLVAALAPSSSGGMLDVCAGRGGKTLQIADEHEHIRVLALDLDPRRLRAGAARAATMGIGARVGWVAADARLPLPLRNPVEAALVDVPCSGLGTIRRHPEIKWRVTPRHLAGFAALQREILARSLDALASGGSLLYVTCSTEPEENEEVVDAVLQARSAVRVEPIDLGGPAARLVGGDGYFRTAPAAPDLDGFFAARLVKSGR